MPVTYNKEKGKWCMGSRCVYDSKKKAEAAERAYHANKKTKKVNKTMDLILKATASDKRNYLNTAIKQKFSKNGVYCWCHTYDDDYVYFSADKYISNEGYLEGTFRVSYEMDGVNVSIGDDLTEVVKESTFTPLSDQSKVEEFTGQAILKGMKDLFKEYFGKEDNKSSLKILKQFEEEQMIAYEPLYCPPDTADGVGEGMDEENIRKMVDGIKSKIEKGTMQANLFHKVPTDAFEWTDCFINEWPDDECMVGDTALKKGQPIAVCKYKNEKAWELRKAGKLMGPSIEGVSGNKREVKND